VLQAIGSGRRDEPALVGRPTLLPPACPARRWWLAAIFLAATPLFSISPVTQSRLIQMTDGAPVALALNGSVFAMGQALGSTLGGAALAGFGVPAIPAAALMMSAVAFSTLCFVFPVAATAMA
jgi:predicted MFS family arabinose efflux permease